MTAALAAQAPQLDGLAIERPAVSTLLLELGVELDGPDAAAVVLGATDLLLALELAQSLPPQADYRAAVRCLHTFSEVPLIPSVREAQAKILELASQQFLLEIQHSAILAGRLRQLQGAVYSKTRQQPL